MKRTLKFGLATLLLLGTSAAQGEQDWTRLSMAGDAAGDWQFYEGAWSDDGEIMRAPGNLLGENLAIYTGRAYQDFEAEFAFRWDGQWTTAGLIFRATDARHYYLVHFPAVGQQRRAEHFWGCISKVDGNGLVEILNMELVHGVSSNHGIWHQVRVVAEGNEIRVWVDGRPLRAVTDDTLKGPGYVGLVTHKNLKVSTPKSSFHNLRIRGPEAKAPEWDPKVQTVKNWFKANDETGEIGGNLMRTPGGHLLVPTVHGGLLRSTDNGRTWTGPEPLPESLRGLYALHTTADGRLAMQTLKNTPPFHLQGAISKDDGQTWSDPVPNGEVIFPDEWPIGEVYGSCSRSLKDGSWLIFLFARTKAESVDVDGRRYISKPPPGNVTICMRSTDDGKSWSGPFNLDGRAGHEWIIAKDMRSEISTIETRDGQLVAFVRPYSAPLMWESWSHDGGMTWTPAALGPFTMYACNDSVTATSSGALLIGGRFPGLAVHVSHDDGMSWKGYRIDTAAYANGAMYEVAPDVVLFVYGGLEGPSFEPSVMRGQFLRVTPDGLEPAREFLP